MATEQAVKQLATLTKNAVDIAAGTLNAMDIFVTKLRAGETISPEELGIIADALPAAGEKLAAISSKLAHIRRGQR